MKIDLVSVMPRIAALGLRGVSRAFSSIFRFSLPAGRIDVKVMVPELLLK